MSVPKIPGPIANSTLPDREQEICLRFREVRIKSGMKLAAFADMLGIPVGRLKSYELARAPIRYDLGASVCARFNVNQAWLAWGIKPRRPWVSVPEEISKHIPGRMLFSDVFDRLLDTLILEAWASVGGFGKYSEYELDHLDLAISLAEVGASENLLRKEFIEANLASLISREVKDVPSDLLNVLYVELGEFFSRFKGKYREQVCAYLEGLEQDPTRQYDSHAIKAYVEAKLGQVARARAAVPSENAGVDEKKSSPPLTEYTSQRTFSANESPLLMQAQPSSIRYRISAALEKTGLSQAKFAKTYGINRRSLENWLYRGREPKGLYLDQIEKILRKIEAGS